MNEMLLAKTIVLAASAIGPAHIGREAKAISDRRCVPIADEQLLL